MINLTFLFYKKSNGIFMVGKSKLMNNSTKTLYSYLILTASSSLSRLSSSARLNSSLMIALLIPTVYNKCYWKDAKGKKHNTIKKRLGRRRKKTDFRNGINEEKNTVERRPQTSSFRSYFRCNPLTAVGCGYS